VAKPCFDVPGVGRIAIIEDPTGAMIGIMTAAPGA
jgi:predicted enzyme related to lactoylglutathione lyase